MTDRAAIKKILQDDAKQELAQFISDTIHTNVTLWKGSGFKPHTPAFLALQIDQDAEKIAAKTVAKLGGKLIANRRVVIKHDGEDPLGLVKTIEVSKDIGGFKFNRKTYVTPAGRGLIAEILHEAAQ